MQKPQLFRMNSHSSLSSEQKTHMLQVHGVVGVGLALAATGSKIHMDGGIDIGLPIRIEGSDWMTLVQLLCIIGIGYGEINPKTKGISLWRGFLYLLCAFAAGLNVGTWVLYAAQENGLCAGDGWTWFPDIDWMNKLGGRKCELFEELIFSSCLLTAGTYFCFFVAALIAPPGTGQIFAPFVTCSLFILSLTYWVSRIFGWMGSAGFDIIYVQFGLVVYCIKVFMDTQEIYKRVRMGERDVISHALVILFNILHLFIRIVVLVARVIKSKDKIKCAIDEIKKFA